MKKLILIFVAAFLVSCGESPIPEPQKPVEEPTEEPKDEPEKPDSPVVEDGPAVFVGTRTGTWRKTDEIVLIGSGQKMYSGQNSTSTLSKASFKMDGLTVKDGSIRELQDKDYPWYPVIFPKSAVTDAETSGYGDVVKAVTLPEKQSLLDYHDINILYAVLTNGGENSGYGGDYNGKVLEFNRACAVLTMKVKGTMNIRSIEITAPDGTDITGTGSFSCYEGGWYSGKSDMFSDSPEGSFEGSSKVVLEADSPVQLKGDKYTAFNACVIPARTYLSDKSGKPETLRSNTVGGAVAGEYTIKFTDTQGRTITKVCTLEEDTAAGKSASLGSFELGKSVVETASVAASAMNRNVDVIYIVPETASEGNRCPVVYLLHGWSDNPGSWLSYIPKLQQISNEKEFIIVCPNGNNSWYLDSPVKGDFQYETFIYKDLVGYTDANYPTVADRRARAIAGISMGGHGAMYNAFRHQDVFGAVCSMSGGVDICYDKGWANNWNIKDVLGPRDTNLDRWKAHSVMSQLDKLTDGSLDILFVCGSGDFFYQVNNNLHDELDRRGITHTYDGSSTAGHGWASGYWQSNTERCMNFFVEHFNR